VLVASTSQIMVPIWLPHWSACTRIISREEEAWRRGARGSKRARKSGQK
jgi:hypothetical protein